MCISLTVTAKSITWQPLADKSWRDLSYPSERTVLQEIMHETEIQECCFSTAAEGTQVHSKQLPGEGALHRTGSILTICSCWHSLGARASQLRTATAYCSCFEEAHLHKNCSLVLPFFAKLTWQSMTVVPHWELALKKLTNQTTSLYVTISNSILLCLKSIQKKTDYETLIFLFIYTLLQP